MANASDKSGVTYDRHGWIVKGRRPFINCGEIHYFRVPPDQWTDRLLKARQAFLNAIGAYMAWNWHEKKPGEMDFEGGRNLDRWLSLIEEQGLYIIARPGPYICSEWDFGGFPGWLAAVPCEMRSMDPAYLDPCGRWLAAADEIIERHQLDSGGTVIMYQIENEFFWGDVPYHLFLKQLAEEHGISVPIVTNENKAVRGTEIIETPDPYPRHVWDTLNVENAIRELLEMQPDKPPFGMEVQGGFFSKTGIPFTAYSQYAGGRISADWTDVYIKTLIAAGLNGLNYYMFHGGTNLERFASKYMTTTYDFDASIREWGELSERYYVVRRLGGLLTSSLGDVLVGTDPAPGFAQSSDRTIEMRARSNDGVAFLFPRNLNAQEKPITITFAHPATGRRMTIPRQGPYIAGAYCMGLLPISVSLRPGLTLEYATSQVFHLSNAEETTLIVWEREGFAGEILISGPEPGGAKVQGAVQSRIEPDGLLLNYRHVRDPQLIRVTWPDERPLRVLVLDPVTAGCTWLLEKDGQVAPMPSNVYLLRGSHQQGDELILDVELRAGRPVELALPFSKPPRSVTMDGQPAKEVKYEAPGLVRVGFDMLTAPTPFWDLTGTWRSQSDEKEAAVVGPDDAWQPGLAGQMLEAQGLYENGYYWFRRTFEVARQPEYLWLICPDVNDEITAYVNGAVVGHGLHRLEVDIAPHVRSGQNVIALRVESTGRENGGFLWPNGLLQPVYLDEVKRELTVNDWRAKAYPPLPKDQLRAVPAEAQPTYDDSLWPQVKVSPWVDTRLTGRWTDVRAIWYRTTVDVPDDWAGCAFSVDFASVQDEAWVYVNGELVGSLMNRAFHSRAPGRAQEVGDALRPGQKNSIAIYVLTRGPVGGLYRSVRLVAHERTLRSGWQIVEGLGGERAGWALPTFDDSNWSTVEVPEIEPRSATVAWYRRPVEIALPEKWVLPLRLTVTDTPGVATLFFNGTLIGRYCEEGPQQDFYIYEHLLRPRNIVAIAVDGRGQPARLGRVSISPYCTTRRAQITIKE
jgi:beta-galactosidase